MFSSSRSLCAATLKQHSLQRQWVTRRLLSNTTSRLASQVAAQSASKDADGKSNVKGRPGGTDAIVEGVEDDEGDSLQFLQRPLGVAERPTTVSRSWTQNMLDDATRTAQREKLLKEATKGYFTDINATRQHGGKTWIAPQALIRHDQALYFPDITGTPLSGGSKVHSTDLLVGKVSLVTILSSKISEIQANIFVQPTHAKFKDEPLYQHVQINLQENLFKSLLVSLAASSIRKSIPEQQWGTYLISNQNMDYIREDIGMSNRHLGYVYLVDPACRIRWAGCADPLPKEIQALEICTRVLLNRSGEKKG